MTEVRPARDAAEVRAALDLRHEVFVVEQHVPVEEEYDEHDDTALHLVAVEDDGRIVATARVVMDGATAKLGRVAVAQEARRRGIASRLIEHSEAHARAQGATRIALAAQTGALPLYEKAGYTAYGERFMDANLEHLMMQKRLD
jgi:predicted GNAT family N-acyltransferase